MFRRANPHRGQKRSPERIAGIVLGVLVLAAAIFALVFWLEWRKSNQLDRQAFQAYSDGNATAALEAYQEYSKSFILDDDDVKRAKRRIDTLQEVLNASRLQQGGQVDQAVAAYQAFLEGHHYSQSTTDPYYYLAHKALAELQPQWAQQLQEAGDFAAAIEIYGAILAQESIVEGECPYDHEFCQEALTAIEESRVAVVAAVPSAILDWYQAASQDGDYLAFTKRCDSLLKAYPEILDAPDGRAARARVDELLAALPAWFSSHPACPAIDFSAAVARNTQGQWVLITHFRETSGLVSYTLQGTGWIIDAQGEKWREMYGTSDIDRGEVSVPAGGEAEDTYRFSGDVFIDGDAFFTWAGEDEGGNPITLEEQVHLLP